VVDSFSPTDVGQGATAQPDRAGLMPTIHFKPLEGVWQKFGVSSNITFVKMNVMFWWQQSLIRDFKDVSRSFQHLPRPFQGLEVWWRYNPALSGWAVAPTPTSVGESCF